MRRRVASVSAVDGALSRALQRPIYMYYSSIVCASINSQTHYYLCSKQHTMARWCYSRRDATGPMLPAEQRVDKVIGNGK